MIKNRFKIIMLIIMQVLFITKFIIAKEYDIVVNTNTIKVIDRVTKEKEKIIGEKVKYNKFR